MAERPPRWTAAELEPALHDLGARLAYPPTPPLARSVRARLAAGPARPRPSWAALWPAPRRLALVLLALLALGAGLLAFSPAARTTLAERLGLRGITIVEATPPPPLASPASPSPPATRAPVGTGYRLGQRLTLAEAQGRVAYPVLTPSLPELLLPDEVYVGEPPRGGQVALVYTARPGLPPAAGTGLGLLITQFRGDLAPDFFGKGIGLDTRLEPLTVNGGRGFWIEGQPHTFFYRDANGRVTDETIRLAGNTLLWEQDGLTFRLEAALTKDEALRIAASMR